MAIRPEQAPEVIGQTVALAAQLEKEAKVIPPDKRAKVHMAGLNNPAFEQRCDRCHCVLVPRGDKSWEPGTTVAYFGHGHWSRLDPHEASDHNLYRPCGHPNDHHRNSGLMRDGMWLVPESERPLDKEKPR